MQTEPLHHEEPHGDISVSDDERRQREAAERWPEQRRRIRELRARTKGLITLGQLVTACIIEDIFEMDDLEDFVVEGIKRRVLNACQDMRTGRRG